MFSSIIDVLWQTGILWAQAKALQLFTSAVTYALPSPPPACSAMLQPHSSCAACPIPYDLHKTHDLHEMQDSPRAVRSQIQAFRQLGTPAYRHLCLESGLVSGKRYTLPATALQGMPSPSAQVGTSAIYTMVQSPTARLRLASASATPGMWL